MIVKIGITATRQGATDAQINTLIYLLRDIIKPTELHHGDCVGGDEDAHNVAVTLGIKTISHPCNIEKMRAHCLADYTHTPKYPLERNKDIVNQTSGLLAMPKRFEQETRSGTWATVRYAQKIGNPVEVIWPNGSTTLYV